jgi:hypothetical protein
MEKIDIVENSKLKNYEIFFLFFLIFLIPIDWFSPSGEIFREAGAKPINLFVLFTAILAFIFGRPIHRARAEVPVQLILFLIFLIGSISFAINFLIFESADFGGKSPLSQYLAQSGMILLFAVNLHVLVYFFRQPDRRHIVQSILPAAALLHLFFYFLEYVGVLKESLGSVFDVFRNENGFIERASGLMSEPSYYGTFAALYAVPLFFYSGRLKAFNRILAVILLITALIAQAKTMILVLLFQVLFIGFLRFKSTKQGYLTWLLAIISIPIAYSLVYITGATNVEENLSSNMRLGSNIVAFNAAADGYGIFGSGIGQFHFLFLPEYAPDFLFLSKEAQAQFYGDTTSRYSTFNLPLRLLVETGIIGFLLFLFLIFLSVRHVRGSNDGASFIGICFVGGSFGFLMTQDTYCLPSLFFGLALVITERTSLEKANLR